MVVDAAAGRKPPSEAAAGSRSRRRTQARTVPAIDAIHIVGYGLRRQARRRVMSYLYCAADGRIHENRVISQEELYREEGESVLIVKGILKRGPWRCDKCNLPLRKGDPACLLSAFPRYDTQSMHYYDFAGERRYFAMKGAETLTLIGAAWPCGDPATLLPEAR
jgi:hypothetical protein